LMDSPEMRITKRDGLELWEMKSTWNLCYF
jgi:hypothetical protein